MRRADRLFRIVQLLRAGRLKTAQALAERLQVSERTIYRDIRDLQLAGQPIEGEAGVGYTMRREFDLPPLMFTVEELTALVVGARLVQAWGGEESFAAAKSALARIEAVIPAELSTHLDSIALYAPPFVMSKGHRRLLDQLHRACRELTVVEFWYTRIGEDMAQAEYRAVRPLALAFWSGFWTLAAWCELRNDFRTFRMDRLHGVVVTERSFVRKRGQRLEDFLRSVGKRKPDAM
ncbi:helix-turn-helix transcriptional regulator [Granulicella cerasi]|uniref:Helix-turn-helix transcriptional regulator n=1 Tax=Granulicella cerasi TaxID=741063 RepID=A0ABW1ZCM9_9BACT|nr:YafY family protein [Granulicella cerasi]